MLAVAMVVLDLGSLNASRSFQRESAERVCERECVHSGVCNTQQADTNKLNGQSEQGGMVRPILGVGGTGYPINCS